MSDIIISEAGKSDYSTLEDIWERAVIATHDFLEAEDFVYYKEKLISEYFPQVSLWIAKRETQAVGFIGLADDFIEMLFIDPDYQQRGIGKQLIEFACQYKTLIRVDVNEQNTQAVIFYKKHRFMIVARSETDGHGKAYPILHLKKSVDIKVD